MVRSDTMVFQKASLNEFDRIRAFYWALIDAMSADNDKIGWKKGIYPTDDFLRDSLEKGTLYTLTHQQQLAACVIVNSDTNEGYASVPWRMDCADSDVLIPHALAVSPALQGQGIGREVVAQVQALARRAGKRAVRLDILGTNTAAERLYTRMGFQFVQAKPMFYEDTGWTEYKLYEWPCQP